MATSAIHDMISSLRKADGEGIIVSVKELKENQFVLSVLVRLIDVMMTMRHIHINSHKLKVLS